MLLQDVLDATQLRIRPRHVPDGALSRPVNWTFTTDLLDPRRYLIRGQLVLSGLMWRRTRADSETFVAALADGGAVALLAGEGLYGTVPDDVVEACRRHDLPLFAVPSEVSFAAVTAYVANALANDRVSQVMAGLSRQRALLTEVYQGRLLDDLIGRTAQELGRPLWLVTATGRPVVRPVEPLADLDRVITTALTAEALPATVDAGPGRRLMIFAVGGGLGSRLTDWFLVVAGNREEWPPLILDTANELSAVAALYRIRDPERNDRTALIDRLISIVQEDAEAAEAAVHLRQVGLAPEDRLVVVVAGVAGHPEESDLAGWLLRDAIAHFSEPVVGRDPEGRVTALLPAASGDEEPITARLGSILTRLSPGLRDRRLRVGVSPVGGLAELGGALRSARYALAVPQADGDESEAVQIRDSAQVTSAVQLLAMAPDHLRRIFVDRTLRPIIDHDDRQHSQLLATLTAFLDCGGSWVRTAELTHLHLNTVRYRIGRVEELTGRDLSTTADRADLHLALALR